MRNRLVFTLLSGVLVLSACATQQVASPSPEPPTLKGTEWTVTKIKGADTIVDSQPTISFEGDRIAGTSGCNRFFGGYTQDGANLKFDAVGATAMYCAEVADQESAFFDALSAVGSVQKAEAGIELASSSGDTLLTLTAKEPEPDKPLEETQWTLTSIVNADAASSIVGDNPVTLTITDGSVHVSVCNQINGSVTVDGQSLDVGQLMSTRMACPSEEETIQEGTVISVLEAATAFSIEGSTLTIKASDQSLVFRAN